jgi:ABC-2 type transport system permease protein
MGIVPARVLMLAKMLGSLLFSTATLVLSGFVLMLFAEVRLVFRWEAIPVVILTWVGLFGLGFIVAGGTLLFKRVGQAVAILTGMLLFVNGTLLPLETLSPTLSTVGRLFPAAQGIIVLRAVVLEGRTLGDVLGDGSAIFLMVHSTVLFALGWLIFGWAETIAKQRGSLGQY